jgi:DNA repair exonuclease SbcCD nuclease subunit
MKALIIGDPHFKVKNAEESQKMCNAIYQICEKENFDFIVDLGDTLDTHETMHLDPFNSAITFLQKLSVYAPVYVIIGNHDRPNNSVFCTQEHPFNALKFWPRVKVIDDTLLEIIQGYKFMFVPYVPPGRFEEALNRVTDFADGKLQPINWKDDITCIFAHQEFKDAKMGAIKSVEGDTWPLDYPFTISGHIHDYDYLQSNIIYTGSPIQHGYGDKPDKAVMICEWTEKPIVDEKSPLKTEYETMENKNVDEIKDKTTNIDDVKDKTTNIDDVKDKTTNIDDVKSTVKRIVYVPKIRRIDLGLPKKRTVRLEAKDITLEKLKELNERKDHIKIVIKGDKASLAEVTRNQLLLNLNPNIKVTKQTNTTSLPITSQQAQQHSLLSIFAYLVKRDEPTLAGTVIELFPNSATLFGETNNISQISDQSQTGDNVQPSFNIQTPIQTPIQTSFNIQTPIQTSFNIQTPIQTSFNVQTPSTSNMFQTPSTSNMFQTPSASNMFQTPSTSNMFQPIY